MHAQKSFSSSTCLRVVLSVGGRSVGRALPNVLSINYKLNYWRMWDGNIGKWINFNTYRTVGRSILSIHPTTHYTPCTPRGNDFSSSPCQAAAGNGSVVGDFVRCYVGRSVCPTLATIPWSFCPRRRPPLPPPAPVLLCHRMDIITYNSSFIPQRTRRRLRRSRCRREGDRNSFPAGPTRGQANQQHLFQNTIHHKWKCNQQTISLDKYINIRVCGWVADLFIWRSYFAITMCETRQTWTAIKSIHLSVCYYYLSVLGRVHWQSMDR